MKEWILICNTNYYDIKAAFDTHEYLTWPQISNVSVGDTVYCYVTNPYRAVLYSCVVSEIGLTHMDDASKEYVKHALFYDNKQEYMRLKLTTRYPETLYTDTILKENGIESLQMTTLVPYKLFKFFHNNKRKTKKVPIIVLAGLIAFGAIGTGLYYRGKKNESEILPHIEESTTTAAETTSSDDKKKNELYTVYLDGDVYGQFKQGDTVDVAVDESWTASDYSCGEEFGAWEVSEGNIEIEDIHNSKISFTMPAENVKLNAEYSYWDAAPINLTVENASGTTMCFSGSEVAISADVKEGYEFSSWSIKEGSAYIKDTKAKETTVTFDKGYSGDVIIEAAYTAIKTVEDTYKVTVVSGTGDGEYHAGDTVSVKADEIDNKVFTRWKVIEGDISFPVRESFYGMLELISASDEIEFDMPKGDVKIEAMYTDRCVSIDDEATSGEIRSRAGNCYYGYTDSSNNGSGFLAVYTDTTGNILGCLKLYYQITRVEGDDNYGAIMIAYSDKDCEIDSTADVSISDGGKSIVAKRYSWENGRIILDIGKGSDNKLIVRDPDFDAIFKTKSISTDKYIDMHENIIALNWTSNLREVGEYANYLLNYYHDDPDQIEVTKEMAAKVQTKLNELGYECGTADGIIGSKSQKAIENFQKDNGINVTGTVTQELLDKLGIN